MQKPWTEIELPPLPSEIWEFAFPLKDRMLLRTEDGLYCLTLQPITLAKVMTADEIAALDNTYSWGSEQSQHLSWDNDKWFFHSSDGGDVTLCDLATGERIEMNEPDYNQLLIVDSRDKNVIQTIEFPLLQDPDLFSIAGFSEDEKYLVLCSTEKLQIFRSPH